MTRGLRAAAAALVLAAVLIWPGAPPGRAQQATDTSRVFLASQKAWVAPNEDIQFSVRVASAQPVDSLELAITLCKAVTSRSEFVLTVQDKARCSILDFQNPPLTRLSDDGNGGLAVQIAAQDHLVNPGVYPLRVELRNRDHEQLDHFITHVVVATPAPEETRLGVAWVIPIHGPLVTTKEGGRTLLPPAADRVATTIANLTSHPFVPLTLLPTPATLDLLAGGRPTDEQAMSALTTEAQATATRQIVTGPYVPVDLPSMQAAGLSGEIAAQVGRGGDAISERLKARPDPRTWVADGSLDDQSVASLSDRGVDRLVLPESSLTPLNLSRTLTQPFAIEARPGRRVVTMAADSGLAAHFQPTDNPVLAAHQFLADLAVVYFDSPGSKTPRALVAVPGHAWPSDPAFLNTALDGLTDSPVLAPMTLDEAFTSVPAAAATKGKGPMLRTLAKAPLDPDAALSGSSIRSTRHRLDAFGSMLEQDNQASADVFDDLERGLLAAESSDIRGRQHSVALNAVDQGIDKQIKLVHMPANRSVRLTARQGDIPITVLSEAPYPVHVLLVIERTDKLRFTTPEMPPLTRRATVVPLGVEARTSGAFPLKVSIQSPAEGITISQTHFTVRSTAASGVGIVLSAGAGLFLLVWWVRHLRHGRRARQLVPA